MANKIASMDLMDVLQALKAQKKFTKVIADGFSSGGSSDGLSEFDRIGDFLGVAIAMIEEEMSDGSNFVGILDSDGVFSLGSEKRPELLSVSEIKGIKDFGRF